MSKLNINRLTNENEDGSPRISGITSFSSSAFLETPKGTTAQRPENVSPGMIRFNTDSGHLEYYNGVEWTEVLVANNTLDGGARGVFAGGYTPTLTDNIDYVTISTLGNAIDFGNLTTPKYSMGATGSQVTGLFGGGRTPTFNQDIEKITFSSTGQSVDTNANLNSTYNPSACASKTRALFAISSGPAYHNAIDYVTIATISNAQDFGDLTIARGYGASFSSSTRGIFAGGIDTTNNPPATPAVYNIMDYVTITTTGNSQDFGDLYNVLYDLSGSSNSTRGIFAGGRTPALKSNIDYITISSTGDSQTFGDLSSVRVAVASCSSPTRVVFIGGSTPSLLSTMEYITINTTGDSLEFGDLSTGTRDADATSNGHGGL